MENVVQAIGTYISNLLSSVRKPLTKIPSALIAGGTVTRPGLSSIMTTSNILRRQAEAGAYSGPLRDGSANIAEAMERVRVEEIINAIKSDLKIEISIPPGGIQIAGTGECAVGPVAIQGSNVNFVEGNGIAR